jgi:putative peptide zinc metalloprotease protein
VPAATVAGALGATGAGLPLNGVEGAVLLLVGALVVAAGFLVRVLRPPAAAAAAAVLLATLPWPGAGAALSLAVPAVAVVAMLLIHAMTHGPDAERPHPLLRLALLAPLSVLIVVGALTPPTTAQPSAHLALASWLTAPGSAQGTLAVPPGMWADLVRDGVPSDRLVPAAAAGRIHTDWVVVTGPPSPGTGAVARIGSGAATLTVVSAGFAAGSAPSGADATARRAPR